MRRSLLVAMKLLIGLLLCLSLQARAQSSEFQPLNIGTAKDTTFEQYTIRLAGPDNADKPSMWEGPVTVSGSKGSCSADVSLITAVYAAPHRSFLIVLSASGSNQIANFIELATCASKWPAIKRAASKVKVAGNRISFLPVCEGGESNAPALCTAARVYIIHSDSPPTYMRPESYRLTAKELGVGFTGEAKVTAPHTPRAMVVH
jgi:hypothetical protein